jgi:hypothetical protein
LRSRAVSRSAVGRFRREHVIELPPLRGRHTTPIAAGATLFIFQSANAIGRLAPLTDSAIPHDLHTGIVRKRARQQLEGGKVATPHDDESWLVHGIR